MGCWCETCGITQLPINAGDKCRVFLIVHQDYDNGRKGGGFCYANDVWYPRGLPVRGTYNDYGGIENIIEGVNTNILLNGLKKDWAPFKAKNEWEKDVNSDELTIETIIDMASQDDAEVHDGDSPTHDKRFRDMMERMKQGDFSPMDESEYPEDRQRRTLGLMFVHEDVYQAMINYDPVDAHHSGNGYLYRSRSKIFVDDMKAWYTGGLRKAKEYDLSKESKLWKSELLNMISHWNVFGGHRHDPPFCKGISYYYEFLHQKMEEGVPYEDPEVQAVTKGLIEFTKFTWAMSEARRAWMPQSGKGSQNNETAIHKILAGTVIAICAKEDLERAQWDDGVDWKAKHNEEELLRRAEKAKDGSKEGE